MTKLFLGVDLGGTGVKLAIVNEKGKIIEQNSFPNYCPSDPDEVVGGIIYHFNKMKNVKKLCGTGIGVAGDIDQPKGVVRFSPNLGWKNLPLKNLLNPSLPKPLMIDNDANAAAWGAYWLETNGKIKNVICVTLGTGIGGGLILNGQLYRGVEGSAGEIGHMPFEPYGLRCNCGSLGCVERYLGANYLSMQAKEAVERGGSKIILKLTEGNIDKITPQILTEAANLGDELSREIWHQAGERLGIVLAGVVNLLNPEMIVLAGGVSLAGQLLLKPLRETIKKRAFRTPAKACQIIVSRYNQNLGVVGAALLSK
ncbi:MAG: ROK family protein [Elusimicrobia bacterium]|nr:ROK family protein [Candidatus Liberimonas magnetica]